MSRRSSLSQEKMSSLPKRRTGFCEFLTNSFTTRIFFIEIEREEIFRETTLSLRVGCRHIFRNLYSTYIRFNKTGKFLKKIKQFLKNKKRFFFMILSSESRLYSLSLPQAFKTFAL